MLKHPAITLWRFTRFASKLKALLHPDHAPLELVQRMGLKVPSDIAVSGFDGLRRSATSSPALTTVERPMSEIGSTAARMLWGRIENKRAPYQRVVLGGEVVLRQSA